MLNTRAIQRIRKRNKQTQEVVAELSHMRREIWSKIETGQRMNITMDTLDNMAKALRVKPGELVK
jgi:transcriptional regulator with XRE-family HTH domain